MVVSRLLVVDGPSHSSIHMKPWYLQTLYASQLRMLERCRDIQVTHGLKPHRMSFPISSLVLCATCILEMNRNAVSPRRLCKPLLQSNRASSTLAHVQEALKTAADQEALNPMTVSQGASPRGWGDRLTM